MPEIRTCNSFNKKIALAGNMKTAIKRLLDTTIVPPEYPHYYLVPINRWNELKKAMEAYLNCESGSVNTDKS